MKIISINLNGIRSAKNKNFFEWLKTQNADYICMQEIKAQEADLDKDLLAPNGYYGYFHFAQKKGYSGTGIYSKQKSNKVIKEFGNKEFESEGRYIECHYENIIIVSIYFPSGSSGELRQEAKFKFMNYIEKKMEYLKNKNCEVIICGDWNIAHKEIDLKNWKNNKKNSGFLPEERDWISKIFEKKNWVDVYRHLHPNRESESYTWWSNRGEARKNNVGWRIDYQVSTPKTALKAIKAEVFKEISFSDHAPLIVIYD